MSETETNTNETELETSTESTSNEVDSSTATASDTSEGSTETQAATSLFTEQSENNEDDKEKDGELIFGKYKSMEEAEKGYKNLMKKMSENKPLAPETTDDNPFGYSYAEAFEKNGLSVLPLQDEDGNPIDDNKAYYDETFSKIREAGFNQEQFEVMTEVGAKWLNDQMQAFVAEMGPQVDVSAEQEKLPEIFGDKYQDTVVSITKWATSNLPTDVFTKPLNQTAEGMKVLNILRTMNNEQVDAAVDTDKATVDEQALEKQIDELMRSKEYRAFGSGKNPTQKKVEELIRLREQASA